jgi:hypothetical protein
MYRIKNNTEMQESGDGECVIAKCHHNATHIYDNIYNQVPLCDEHFEKIKSLQYGE